MRLFIKCNFCKNKMYLDIKAYIRNELPHKIERKCSECDNRFTYTPNEVYAEVGTDPTIGGGVAGAALGAVVAGPLGLVIGGALGAGTGSSAHHGDKAKVVQFNKSRYEIKENVKEK